MNELLNTLLSLLGSLLSIALPYLILAALGLVAFRILTPKVIRFLTMKRHKMNRAEYEIMCAVLAHESVVEMYSPSSRHMTEYDSETKRRKQHAWMSAYPRAVKSALRRAGRTPNGVQFDARGQIREVAKRISVGPLPEDSPRVPGLESLDGDHYRIDLRYDGHATSEIEGLKDKLKNQLGLKEIDSHIGENALIHTFLCHRKPSDDRLVQEKHGKEFYDEHPATSVFSIPAAVLADGSVWEQPIAGTLVTASSGQGKGSVMQGMIRQLLPFYEQGLVKFYGGDPKYSELKLYDQKSTLFEEIARTPEDILEMVRGLHIEMLRRQDEMDIVIDEERGIYNIGREYVNCVEMPLIVVFIDEYHSLMALMRQNRRMRDELDGLLEAIFAQGRSSGFAIVLVTQDASKDALGTKRNNASTKIILGQESQHINDLFLGEGAAKAGYDSTQIGASNPKNKYRYSGIAFVKGESGAPIKVRFPFTSSEDMWKEVAKRFPKTADTRTTAPISDDEFQFEDIDFNNGRMV